MASIIVASTTVTVARAAIEARDIHVASCRYRRQALVCSACTVSIAGSSGPAVVGWCVPPRVGLV